MPAEPFLTYLNAAADGTNPLSTSRGRLTLVDAAKHDILSMDAEMTVPDDFPLGTYTVAGKIKDLAGNESTVTLILMVAGNRPPVVTITMSQLSWPPVPGAASYNVYRAPPNRTSRIANEAILQRLLRQFGARTTRTELHITH